MTAIIYYIDGEFGTLQLYTKIQNTFLKHTVYDNTSYYFFN